MKAEETRDRDAEKFTDLMMLSIKRGFFELQMNVVSSEQLIAAKKNPEKYKNLVVRAVT